MRDTITRFSTLAATIALSLAVFSSCSNDPTLNNPTSGNCGTCTFIQVDRSGNAGVTEVFIPWARHDASNRATPLADSSAALSDINTFVTGFAGRSGAIANFVANALTPDVLIADMSQTPSGASYLGVETAGQINDYCQGYNKPGSGLFGGRGLPEDVVDTTLQLVFGSLVPQIATGSSVPNAPGPIADDGKEQNGQNGKPQLTTDNVTCSDKHYNLAQFPYLGNPH